MVQIPPLTDTYIKARRQLVLVSAILFGTEVAGIKPSSKDSGINFSVFTLENPGAVTGILFSIIIWLLYRFNLEWFNLDFRRRGISISKVDMTSSIFLAFFAISVSLYQQLNSKLLIDFMSAKAIAYSLIPSLIVYMLSFYVKKKRYFIISSITFAAYVISFDSLGLG
ncbi:MAG: hypothetical protein OQK04_17700, partial [Kangiellaceae bacterium]|nr:hypothetical protein [Kangiellaceae bacterium]